MAFEFGDDSIVLTLRIRDDLAVADAQTAFSVLRALMAKQQDDLSKAAGGSSGAKTVLAQQVEINSANAKILAEVRRLQDEVNVAAKLGLDVAQQQRLVDLQRAQLFASGVGANALKEELAERVALLNVTRELVKEQLSLAVAAAQSAAVPRSQLLSQLTTQERLAAQELLLALERKEESLMRQVAAAARGNLDAKQAQLLLSQRLQVSEGVTLEQLQRQTRERSLQIGQVELALKKEMDVIRTRALSQGLPDPFGFGTNRSNIRSFEQLKDSFSTAEGLQKRFIYLFGGQIGTLIAYGAALTAVTTLVRETVKSQLEFESAVKKVGTVLDSELGAHEADLLRVADAARIWARAHGQAATEVVESLYTLAAAGLSATQVLEAMPAVALLAQGGFLDLANAAGIVATAIQTFATEGLTPIRAANILQATAASTSTTVEELGNAIKYSAGSAVTAGVSFEELNALLGTLGTLGLRGSIAGTSLNQVFLQIAKKQGELRALGVEVTDTTGRMKPFVEIIGELRKAFGVQISVGELALLEEIFNDRGARAVQRLVSDVTVLPQTMREVSASQLEVFRAAEEGADTAAEAWKVFGNQIRNVLLGQGQIATFFKNQLDFLTGREGARAASNLASGAAGTEFVLRQLSEKFRESRHEGVAFLEEISRAGEQIPGPLGERLDQLRSKVDLLRFGGLAQFPWLRTLAADATLFTQQDLAGEIERLGRETQKLQALQEDMARGQTIFESLFGTTPFTDVSGDTMDSLRRGTTEMLQMMARFQQQQAEALLNMVESGSVVVEDAVIERAVNAVEKFRAIAAGLGADVDAAARTALTEQQAKLASDQLATLQSQADLLEAATRTDFESRRDGARRSLQVELKSIDEKLAAQKTALGEEERANLANFGALQTLKDREVEAVEQAENAKQAARLRTKNKIDQINMEELRALYDAEGKIRALEQRSALLGLAAEEKVALERQHILEDFETKRRQILARFERSDKTSQDAKSAFDDLQVARLERDLSLFGNTEAARKTAAERVKIEQEAVVHEARMLVLRAQGAEQFEARRREILAQETAKKTEIGARYEAESEDWMTALEQLHRETETAMTQVTIDETKFREQVTIDSINTVASGLRGIAELVAATSGSMSAKLLEDLAATANAASSTIQILEKMATGAISQGAGVLGIVGLGAGLLASLFGSRSRDDARVVRELTDEFRHQSGRTVSPDFGQARVVNVQINLDNRYEFLTTPDARQLKRVADQLAPILVDELREEGLLG